MSPFFQLKVLPVLARFLIRAIGSTLKIKIRNLESLDELHKKGQPVIFAFWHGHQFTPVYNYRNKGCWVMTSVSRDGEMQDRILRGLGYKTIRGSSTKGGVNALVKFLRSGSVPDDFAFPVDGPRGPFHKVKPGVVLVAAKTGRPIIPVGVAIKNRHVFKKAWDKYQLPLPYTKCVMIIGSPVYASDTDNAEELAEKIRAVLDSVTGEAESELESSRGARTQ